MIFRGSLQVQEPVPKTITTKSTPGYREVVANTFNINDSADVSIEEREDMIKDMSAFADKIVESISERFSDWELLNFRDLPKSLRTWGPFLGEPAARDFCIKLKELPVYVTLARPEGQVFYTDPKGRADYLYLTPKQRQAISEAIKSKQLFSDIPEEHATITALYSRLVKAQR